MDSWCFYQADCAAGRLPGPHDKSVHAPLDFRLLHQRLEPVYERLADKQLLQRCVSGRTQNANECLHSLVWARCSKDNFASRKRVTFAVTTAAGEFCFASYSSLITLGFYGFREGDHTALLGEARLRKRVQNSLKYKQDKSKKRRSAVRAATQKRQKELVDQEGGPAYAAGLT